MGRLAVVEGEVAVNPYVGWGAGEGATQEEIQFLVGHAR
jgi:hypothetical protein